MEADFSGWATKAGLECTDGRTIMPNAFKHQDKMTVPLVWSHGHNTPENILGHAVLENRGSEGVYTYGFFNDTPQGKNAKLVVQHKDIQFLSIYANQLVERAKQVFHGAIREVSLVIAGANPGARIDNVSLAHADGSIDVLDDEAVIFTGLELEHAQMTDQQNLDANANEGPTVQEVYDALDDQEKEVVHYMIGQALDTAAAQHTGTNNGDANTGDANTGGDPLAHKNQEGNNNMTHNVFEGNGAGSNTATAEKEVVLSHDQIKTIMLDSKDLNSFRKGLLAHADEYGITDIELLFPNAQKIDSTPQWITRRIEWVEGVITGCRQLPFSRIRTQSADLTFDSARAKGYIKATMKKEQFFQIAQRITTPKTIYKKQKLDRDDIVDITDFDVVAWMWVEMRFMLREEIARAILVGDGREIDDPDKINEENIRPIALDEDFFTDVVTVPANIGAQSLVEAVLRARNNYRGVGQPTAYMTNAVMTDMLLAKDQIGRRLYRNKAELAAELNVSDIVEVPVMEDVERDGDEILMLLVNLANYAIGSTKGGEITTFDFFDIDFNQHKYLIEGRMSGALTAFKSAQVFVRASGAALATPTVPTFVPATGVVTIPTVAGVIYKNQSTDAVLAAGAQTALNAGETLSVVAEADGTHFLPHNFDADWNFTRPLA